MLKSDNPSQFEFRYLRCGTEQINEFHTLSELQNDAHNSADDFEYYAYMHSKGSSSKLTASSMAWSTFLAKALTEVLPHFPRIAEMGYSAIGSNLAWGIFEDFGLPRLHYSGNFWCSTRSAVMSTNQIQLGSRYAAVRHNAEWWLGTSNNFVPFNMFSTGVDHYNGSPDCIDWSALECQFRAIKAWVEGSAQLAPLLRDPNLKQFNLSNQFTGTMLRQTTGDAPIRYAISQLLLNLLPHHHFPRLLNLHNWLMKILGSRKSSYFYSPVSI